MPEADDFNPERSREPWQSFHALWELTHNCTVSPAPLDAARGQQPLELCLWHSLTLSVAFGLARELRKSSEPRLWVSGLGFRVAHDGTSILNASRFHGTDISAYAVQDALLLCVLPAVHEEGRGLLGSVRLQRMKKKARRGKDNIGSL